MKKLLYFFTGLLFYIHPQTSVAQTVIPGNDFEKWDNMFVELPEGWLTSTVVDPFSERKSAARTTDAYNGKYALRLETVESEYDGEKSILQGFAISGKLGFSDYALGFPCNTRPDRLSFYYKYAPVYNDTMMVSIILQKTEPDGAVKMIGGGYFMSHEKVDRYTLGEADIFYDTEEMPDTAMIVIFSGVDTLHAGSVLFVDYLHLDFHLGDGKKISRPDNIFNLGNIYPQPAADIVNFPLELSSAQQVQVEVTDMLGKRVASQVHNLAAGQNIITLNTAAYKQGVYIYTLKAGNGQTATGKFIISGK